MTLGPIDHVYYWVSDMDRAVTFYEDVLGLKLRQRNGSTWAEFDGGSVTLALHQAVEGWPAEPGGATAVFTTADLDSARSELEGRGVEFGHAGEVGEWARYATFQDPDGNTLQLIEYRGERT